MRVHTGADVDLEQFRIDLKKLAEELRDGDVVAHTIVTEHTVESDEVEVVSIALDITAAEGSRFSKGYTIPYKS